jgi:hypothetical protein
VSGAYVAEFNDIVSRTGSPGRRFVFGGGIIALRMNGFFYESCFFVGVSEEVCEFSGRESIAFLLDESDVRCKNIIDGSSE